jgi:hypothetical protein
MGFGFARAKFGDLYALLKFDKRLFCGPFPVFSYYCGSFTGHCCALRGRESLIVSHNVRKPATLSVVRHPHAVGTFSRMHLAYANRSDPQSGSPGCRIV